MKIGDEAHSKITKELCTIVYLDDETIGFQGQGWMRWTIYVPVKSIDKYIEVIKYVE